MSATSLSSVIRNLSRQLAEALRDGTALVSDGRVVVHNLREAEGWIVTARRYLDAGDPLAQSEVHTDDE